MAHQRRLTMPLLLVWTSFGMLEKQKCSAFLSSASSSAFETARGSSAPLGRHIQREAEQHRKRPDVRSACTWTPSAKHARDSVDLRAHELANVPEQEREDEGFQWMKQWYPVAVMRDLEARNPRQPYPVQLLGEDMVVWKDPTDGEWKAFVDRCPHRWAPLSEGRVDQESGQLHCSYHGWEFGGDGKCSRVPQANPEFSEFAQNSKRACATVIPTKVVEGKMWLWPDSSPDGIKDSMVVEPITVPDIDFESGDFGGQWYARDLWYGADSLVENLVDPAHVPFAHHGIIISRTMGGPMATEIDEEAVPGKDEFLTKGTGYVGRTNMRVGFRAPGLVYYESDYSEMIDGMAKQSLSPPLRAAFWLIKKLNIERKLSMKEEDRKEKSDRLLSYFVGYAVPTTPGRCKVFTRFARNFFLQHPVIPRWMRNSIAEEHLGQHSVLDGDSHLLHVQERSVRRAGEQGVKKPEKVFFMPTSSDFAVRRFRKWYNSRGGGGPPWAQGVDPSDLGPVRPREETLDRMAHTKECSACGKAYKVSGVVKHIAAGGTLLLLGAAAAVPRGSLPLGLASGALACAGLNVAMSRRQQKFVFVDYIHAQRKD